MSSKPSRVTNYNLRCMLNGMLDQLPDDLEVESCKIIYGNGLKIEVGQASQQEREVANVVRL